MGVQRPVQFAVFVGVARERVSLVVGSLQKLGVFLVGEAERCVDGGATAVAVPFLVFFLVIIVKAVVLDVFLDVVFPSSPDSLTRLTQPSPPSFHPPSPTASFSTTSWRFSCSSVSLSEGGVQGTVRGSRYSPSLPRHTGQRRALVTLYAEIS